MTATPEPRTMPGLHIYAGNIYFGQIVERVGDGMWLVAEPEGGYRVMTASDLRSTKLYRERIDASREEMGE